MTATVVFGRAESWNLSIRSSSVKGRLLSKVIFCQRLSSVKSRLLPKVVFCQSCLPLKVVFHQGRLPLLGHFHFWALVLSVAKLSLAFQYLCLPKWPRWPLLRWISRWYCRRGWRQRGPKILNICRTESYRTKIWGRISPGIYWCHQE